jgi:hypothetical protein
VYHLLLAVADDTTHRCVKSRFCKTLAEARSQVARWQPVRQGLYPFLPFRRGPRGVLGSSAASASGL